MRIRTNWKGFRSEPATFYFKLILYHTSIYTIQAFCVVPPIYVADDALELPVVALPLKILDRFSH